MKCFQIIAAAIVLNFSANLFAVDQAWQRIQVLGSSVDGNKILIFKSHFGPCSRAPFARLQIIKSATSAPIFEDVRSAFQGDENTILEFKKDLLEKSAPKIAEAGIFFKSRIC